jgi:hypothetical protein
MKKSRVRINIEKQGLERHVGKAGVGGAACPS